MSSTWPVHGLIGLAVVVAFAILEFALAPTHGRVAAQTHAKTTPLKARTPGKVEKSAAIQKPRVAQPTREKERASRTPPAPRAKAKKKEVTTGQLREAVRRPRFLGGCQAPPIPEALRKSEETIRVRVRLVISEDGVPIQAKMERSHPMISDESVIRCALGQRFEPARLPDGTAVPYPYRRQFKFFVVPHLDGSPQRNAGKAWKRRSSAAF